MSLKKHLKKSSAELFKRHHCSAKYDGSKSGNVPFIFLMIRHFSASHKYLSFLYIV